MEADFGRFQTTEIFVDSEDYTGDTGSQSEMTVVVKPEIQQAMAYKVNSVSIPHSYLNMWPRQNNLTMTLDFAVTGVVVLTIKNLPYTASELITALNQELILSGVTGIVEWRILNGRFELNSTVEAFTITTGYINAVGSLYPFIGFTDADAISLVLAQRGSNTYNLSGPSSLYIASRSLCANRNYKISTAGDQITDTEIVYRVNVTANSGGTINNLNLVNEWKPIFAPKLGKLDLSLLYSDGTLVDLFGLSWQISLSIISKANY